MTGSTITAPPVKARWLVLLFAGLASAVAVFARPETVTFVGSPAGFAAAAAIAAGLVARRSMALTPWGLVAAGLVIYAVQGSLEFPRTILGVLEVVLFSAALLVGVLQMKVRLESGAAASRPSRARWGSVLVAAMTCLVLLVLSRPDVVISRWARGDVDLVADVRVEQSSFGALEVVGWIHNPAITESSGLVARRGSTQLWTMNDSGNLARVYCMNLQGISCGTWNVTGAANNDWEAIAAGPGPDPTLRYLYLGDIGNNARSDKPPLVYRVAQPDPSQRVSGVNQTAPSEALEFAYPDGVHDAEALVVHPRTGDLYVIAKEADAGIYKASPPFETSMPIPLERVARLSIFANFSDITGADISPDGRHVAVSTYGGWYELSLPFSMSDAAAIENFDHIWGSTPARIGRLLGPQWEAIAYRSRGRALFMTSEGAGAAIYRSLRGEG